MWSIGAWAENLFRVLETLSPKPPRRMCPTGQVRRKKIAREIECSGGGRLKERRLKLRADDGQEIVSKSVVGVVRKSGVEIS